MKKLIIILGVLIVTAIAVWVWLMPEEEEITTPPPPQIQMMFGPRGASAKGPVK